MLITQCAEQDGNNNNVSEQEFQNVLSQIKENTLRKMSDKTYNVYDENGYMTESYYTDDEGNVVNHSTYERNENGKADEIYTYIYDDNGNHIATGVDDNADKVIDRFLNKED